MSDQDTPTLSPVRASRRDQNLSSAFAPSSKLPSHLSRRSRPASVSSTPASPASTPATETPAEGLSGGGQGGSGPDAAEPTGGAEPTERSTSAAAPVATRENTQDATGGGVLVAADDAGVADQDVEGDQSRSAGEEAAPVLPGEPTEPAVDAADVVEHGSELAASAGLAAPAVLAGAEVAHDDRTTTAQPETVSIAASSTVAEAKPQPRRAVKSTQAASASAAAPVGGRRRKNKSVVSVLHRTRQLLSEQREMQPNMTNRILVLIAIDHQAHRLPELLQASRPAVVPGSLFASLPQASPPSDRVQISLELSDEHESVIKDLVKAHDTTIRELIDVAVAAEYGTGQ